eukprot:scaffold238988_cov31-Tisochrysis_lutea.AAC.2
MDAPVPPKLYQLHRARWLLGLQLGLEGVLCELGQGHSRLRYGTWMTTMTHDWACLLAAACQFSRLLVPVR